MQGFLWITFWIALSVKPTPLRQIMGQSIAVSPDGRTLWTSDTRSNSIYIYDANTGEEKGAVSRGLGAGIGPLLAINNHRVAVQALKEKKNRFYLVEDTQVKIIPFSLPKGQTLAAFPFIYLAQGSTLVSLLHTGLLTDALAWDFSHDPPLESPRIGISSRCTGLWGEATQVHLICNDGIHHVAIEPTGNLTQQGAVDERFSGLEWALVRGDNARFAWVKNSILSILEFGANKSKDAKTLHFNETLVPKDIAFVPGTSVIALTFQTDDEIWMWDYTTTTQLAKIKVIGPTFAATSEVPRVIWFRTKRGVLRVEAKL